jgi:hypothetical protein
LKRTTTTLIPTPCLLIQAQKISDLPSGLGSLVAACSTAHISAPWKTNLDPTYEVLCGRKLKDTWPALGLWNQKYNKSIGHGLKFNIKV